MTVFTILVAIVIAAGLMYTGRCWWAWLAGWAPLMLLWLVRGGSWGLAIAVIVWLGVAVITGVSSLRQRLLTGPAMKKLAPMFPKISETERAALDAGSVWWDGELFSGAPNWKRIAEFAPRPLTDKEHQFLDGACTQLCRMLDDHAIRAAGDLPAAVWSFIKRERFMGMIIPEQYGGLGFSAGAQSAVIAMLASRNAAACTTVMVPNSLGPAELLLRYGTEDQKNYYLPKLAIGEELPCFALTEPHAGSDAAGIHSHGVVCMGTHNGRQVLGMKLTWDKRYITLAPVATVLGLAFQLFDPEHLLGGETELGITCALIPVATRGVWIGHRHDPMSAAFQNGPTRGTDVFVPLDHVIGGTEMIGQGWRMLMESLSAGRSLSLPANATGAAQLTTRIVGAYASIREQFGLPIGRFEGVAHPLGRIGGTLYWMNAVREVTAGAVDAGEHPSVISAIAKCWSTEAMRRIANDAMDIAGGWAICKGPHNLLSAVYEGAPIGITVEGANILTRSLIVFGQGAIRCHPFALAEMHAANIHDALAFDHALSGHVNFALRNAARSFLLALTGGLLAQPPVDGPAAPVVRSLARLSASFALITDAAMATLGGELKRAENINGRMAEALAWMYIASTMVNRRVAATADAAKAAPTATVVTNAAEDDALFAWATTEALSQAEAALRGVIDNLPNRAAALLLRLCVFPFGARHRPPSDRLTTTVADALLDGGAARLRLTRNMFIPDARELGLGRLEHALELSVAARQVRGKLHQAVKTGQLQRAPEHELLDAAIAKGIVTREDQALLAEAEAARDEATRVDDYAPAAYPHDPDVFTPPQQSRPAEPLRDTLH